MMETNNVWELFSKAQHLHFQQGDILALTTKQPIFDYQIDIFKEMISKISEGITVLVINTDIEISKQ